MIKAVYEKAHEVLGHGFFAYVFIPDTLRDDFMENWRRGIPWQNRARREEFREELQEEAKNFWKSMGYVSEGCKGESEVWSVAVYVESI